MKKWSNRKDHVKTLTPECKQEIEELENLASIVDAMIKQRKALGITQRRLASICGITQSSIARIEALKTAPNLDTLIKILHPLGLKLTVSASKEA
jgi:DNA-binding XRE family transcriptional regulator